MRILIVFLLGLFLGGAAVYYYQQHPDLTARASGQAGDMSTSARQATNTAIAKTRSAAAQLSDAWSEKMQAWHLTPDDIHADLARSGQVARENAARLSERVADARIVAVIKAKFVLERDLDANDLHVESQNGDVVLTGTVTREDLVGKAVGLAMDTEGVHHVTAKLSTRP